MRQQGAGRSREGALLIATIRVNCVLQAWKGTNLCFALET